MADAQDSKSCGGDLVWVQVPPSALNERQKNPEMAAFPGFFYSAPGGARFLRVQVPNPPGSGKDIAEGKGVHCEVESEGSRMWGTY